MRLGGGYLGAKELKDYKAEEVDKTRKAVERAIDYLEFCRVNLPQPDMKSLVQIFYKDKVEFKKTYATRFSSSIPLGLLLAFREQVIIGVGPYKRAEDLVEYLGLRPTEPKDVAELLAKKFKEKRMVPLLTPPTYFDGLSYLDPLLEKKPPTIIRLIGLFHVLSEGHDTKYLDEGTALFKGRLPEDFGKKLRDKITFKIDPHSIAAYPFHKLRIFRLDSLTNLIKDTLTRDPVKAAYMAMVYDEFLTDPLTLGLCGAPQYCRRGATLAAKFGVKAPAKTVFPVDVGKVIADAFDIAFPLDPDVDAVDKLYCDKAIGKARNLLEAFETHIREGKGEDAFGKVDEIKRALIEAVDAYPTIDKEFEKLEYLAGSFSLGFLGLLSLHPRLEEGLAGFLASLAYKVAEEKVRGLAVPKILGYGVRPLPLAVWDFLRTCEGKLSVMEFRELRKKIKERLK